MRKFIAIFISLAVTLTACGDRPGAKAGAGTIPQTTTTTTSTTIPETTTSSTTTTTVPETTTTTVPPTTIPPVPSCEDAIRDFPYNGEFPAPIGPLLWENYRAAEWQIQAVQVVGFFVEAHIETVEIAGETLDVWMSEWIFSEDPCAEDAVRGRLVLGPSGTGYTIEVARTTLNILIFDPTLLNEQDAGPNGGELTIEEFVGELTPYKAVAFELWYKSVQSGWWTEMVRYNARLLNAMTGTGAVPSEGFGTFGYIVFAPHGSF